MSTYSCFGGRSRLSSSGPRRCTSESSLFASAYTRRFIRRFFSAFFSAESAEPTSRSAPCWMISSNRDLNFACGAVVTAVIAVAVVAVDEAMVVVMAS